MIEKRKGIQRKIRFKKLKKAPPGSAPGVISIADDAAKPVVKITTYNGSELLINEISTASGIKEFLKSYPNHHHWVEIKGFGDRQFFEDLATEFDIHRLEMEDVLSGHQRPKIEESENHLFIVSRPISYNIEDEIQDDQLSVFVYKDYVISFQEKQTDYFVPVRERLVQNRGIIRTSGAAYLGYTLMDSVVDNYFPFLERLGNFLDELEDVLLTSPDVYSLQNIQASKRKLILFRRIAWSEREKLNEILSRIDNSILQKNEKESLSLFVENYKASPTAINNEDNIQRPFYHLFGRERKIRRTSPPQLFPWRQFQRIC